MTPIPPDSVDFGTNGGTVITSLPPLTNLPQGSLHTSYGYDSGGRQNVVIDPRGIENLTTFDLLGRQLQTIADYTNGTPTGNTNQTTNYALDANGDVLSMTAIQPTGSSTPNQTTAYVYLVTGGAGALNSNDLLSKIEYPTATGANEGQADTTNAYDWQTFGYDLQGEKITFVDQNGTTHTYTLDVLGRLKYDSAQVAAGNPQNVITLVLSLAYTVDAAGRAYQQISYSGANGTGTLINRVTDTYNGFGQLTTEVQFHGSGFGTGTVQYGYNLTNNGTENNSRLRSITYPNGRIVDYGYSADTTSGYVAKQAPVTGIAFAGTTATVTTAAANGLSAGDKVVIEGVTNQTVYDGTFTVATIVDSTHFTYTLPTTPTASASGTDMTESKLTLDNAISRLDGLQDHSTSGAAVAGTVLEGYAFLGTGTIVQRVHPQTGINLSYTAVSGDPNPPPSYASNGGDSRYTGLDGFGRVVDQNWVNPSTPTTPTDRYQYAYDLGGNVLYKNNMVNLTFSELYHQNSTAPGDNATAYDNLNRLQGFRRGTLSASGNNGTGVLDTVGTLNSLANSNKTWTLDPLGNWTGGTQNRQFNAQNQITGITGSFTPLYDRNGNMIKDQFGVTYNFDPWNRMAVINNGHHEVLEYDADNRRPNVQSCCPTAYTDSYYSVEWQDLEDDTTTTQPPPCCGSTTTHSTYVWGEA